MLKALASGRPSAPTGRNRLWIFFGRPQGSTTENSTYSFEIKDDKGQTLYLRIAMHTRARNVDDNEDQLLAKNQWWDAEVEAKVVAATVLDAMQDASMTQTWPENSPEKRNSPPPKKAKISLQSPEPCLGPGGYAILDLAGDGDCGWRCVAFAVSYANNKGFKDQPIMRWLV